MEQRAEDMMEQHKSCSSNEKKTCTDCGTSKTPLWRGGPTGPKSLCNACGIRNRKKRRGGGENLRRNPKFSESMKQRMMEKQRGKLGEEEQAAVLLMALSCGSLYA